MALTSSQIVTLAVQAAKCPGFLGQAGQLLNTILQELAQTYDFDAAHGIYQFNFNLSLTGTNSNLLPGSGPYPLPSDYLRADPGDVFWTLLGVPYQLTNISLQQLDMTVQQAGVQTYPYWYATDLSASPPTLYVYPPPSGAYPVTVRYRRQMPDITTPETSSTVPWFPNTQYLRTRLTAELMRLTDDDRADGMIRESEDILRRYLTMKDDQEDRSVSVRLDPQRFGKGFNRLKQTKIVGW